MSFKSANRILKLVSMLIVITSIAGCAGRFSTADNPNCKFNDSEKWAVTYEHYICTETVTGQGKTKTEALDEARVAAVNRHIGLNTDISTKSKDERNSYSKNDKFSKEDISEFRKDSATKIIASSTIKSDTKDASVCNVSNAIFYCKIEVEIYVPSKRGWGHIASGRSYQPRTKKQKTAALSRNELIEKHYQNAINYITLRNRRNPELDVRDFMEILNCDPQFQVSGVICQRFRYILPRGKISSSFYGFETLDILKAVDAFGRAARNTDDPDDDIVSPDAQFYLGMFYIMGAGVERDFKTGNKWLLTAAKNGHVLAQIYYARQFVFNKQKDIKGSINQEYKSAYIWLNVALFQLNNFDEAYRGFINLNDLDSLERNRFYDAENGRISVISLSNSTILKTAYLAAFFRLNRTVDIDNNLSRPYTDAKSLAMALNTYYFSKLDVSKKIELDKEVRNCIESYFVKCPNLLP